MKRFPTAYSVLFIVLVIASLMTFIIPAGKYSKLSFNKDSMEFVITNPEGEKSVKKASAQTLKELGVKIDFENFLAGKINKSIAIPNTYQRIPSNSQGFIDTLQAPIKGIADTIDIILFVLIIGGIIGIINKTNAFSAGINSLSKIISGKEYLIIVLITFLMALGGSTFGLSEETIALYPILMPIFLALRYDALVCVATIFIGSSIGSMFSTINPFSVIIASNIAGVNFTSAIAIRAIGLLVAVIATIGYILYYANKVKNDPTKSIIYDEMPEIKEKFKGSLEITKEIKFTFRLKLLLLIFASTFLIMLYGVSMLDWWFLEMSTLFFGVALVVAFISGLGEKTCVNSFISGAADLLGAAFLIGIARSINLILNDGHIADTILNYGTEIASSMSSGLFIVINYISFIIMGFFIPSSSGLAVLSMPIMSPLADSLSLSREIVVSAYIYGQGLITMLTPTGLILATLTIVNVTYNKWLKFLAPLILIYIVINLSMLFIQANI